MKKSVAMKISKEKAIELIIELKYKKLMSTNSILSYFKKEYDINQTRVYEFLKETREIVGDMYNKNNDKVLEETIIMLENMREKSYMNGNDKLALEIQKELNKINQLHIQKVEVSGLENIIVEIVNPKKEEDKNETEGD